MVKARTEDEQMRCALFCAGIRITSVFPQEFSQPYDSFTSDIHIVIVVVA
jgi:hypothetical protein